jgi:asparaginyl-tRNA synthetase
VQIGGWVRTTRHSKGGFSFLAINDGSCFGQLQVVADQSLGNYDDLLHLSAGCSVLATGTVVESQGKGQAVELQADEVRILGRADAESYPIQPKRHSLEFLRTQAHLRPRTNTFGAVARVRNRICSAVHEFFQQRGFLYIHTPIITASDCEGAGELFRVTTLNADAPPRDDAGAVDHTQDFFARQAYLTVSGQLEVETHCCALGDVYTFGPTFRAENSNTPRHLAEFWMVEPEMAFCDLAGDAELAEQFVKHVLRAVLNDCPDDMAFFEQRIAPGLQDSLHGVVEQAFVHLPYTEAIEILESVDRPWDYPVCWGSDLQTEHERYLTEEQFRRPVVVTDFPAAMKPFYMYLNEPDAQGRHTVRAMDILVPRIGEIIGGSEREHRLDVLDARMDAQGLDKDAYWWYRDLRKFGTIPHAGFGLGLERCVQFCTGMANIRDVIPFPRTPRAAEF